MKNKKIALVFNIIGLICWCIWGFAGSVALFSYNIPKYGFQVLPFIIVLLMIAGWCLYLWCFICLYKFKKRANKKMLLISIVLMVLLIIAQIIRFIILPLEVLGLISTIVLLFGIMFTSFGILIKCHLDLPVVSE